MCIINMSQNKILIIVQKVNRRINIEVLEYELQST